jgi:hypothetical protein
MRAGTISANMMKRKAYFASNGLTAPVTAKRPLDG